MATIVLPGYPAGTAGAHKMSVVDILGPASYTTGGNTLDASIFGMKYVTYVGVTMSSDVAYSAAAVFTTRGPQTTFKLFVTDATNGNQAASLANLSAITFRLFAMGM